MSSISSQRRAFLDSEPPPGYIPGLGRGAVGFTTRSDIGPARDDFSAAVAAAAAQGRAAFDDDENKGVGADGAAEDLTETNYDKFAGYGGSLFDTSTPYDADDREADATYRAVEERLDGRRRARREALERERLSRFRAARPKIQQQFADLKPELATLSVAEWAALPEATDQVRPHKRREIEPSAQRYTPVPDSVIASARADGAMDGSLSTVPGGEDDVDGTSTSVAEAGTAMKDLHQLGATRSALLDLRLSGTATAVGAAGSAGANSKASGTMATAAATGTGKSGNVAGRVDAEGYLTELSAQRGVTNAEIGDIKKARLLLKSVRQASPESAAAWVGSARLEEYAGQMAAARRIILEGTRACAGAEDVWLEAARLHGRDTARSIVAEGVARLPQSVELWFRAAELEDDAGAKKRVLRRALEHVPGSVRLWKAAVALEGPAAARAMLARAVECVPHSVELWLAYARLETHENARAVLNAARAQLPSEPVIWVAAARLEEAHGNAAVVPRIIARAVRTLRTLGVAVDRAHWLAEAETCERAGSPATCRAIVAETAGAGLEGAPPREQKHQWRADAEAARERGAVVLARALYEHALSVLPGSKSLWLGLVRLEQGVGTDAGTLAQLFERATQACPRAEVLWLMRAKHAWVAQSNVPGARAVLQAAFAQNPHSEAIWLAAVKLEHACGETERARALLRRARAVCGSARVWKRSVQLERAAGTPEAEAALLTAALRRYGDSAADGPRLWALQIDLAARTGGPDAARRTAATALEHCPKSVSLWLQAAACEGKTTGDSETATSTSTTPVPTATTTATAKARAILEKARATLPREEQLWLAAVRVEVRAGQTRAAQATLARALQECPHSGVLWAEMVSSGLGGAAKNRAVDALRQCENDPDVIIAVATSVFWRERRLDKARAWLEKAVRLRPDHGDGWAYLAKFERENGTPESLQGVVHGCNQAAPTRGERWRAIAKAPENRNLSTEQILERVVTSLPEI